MKRVALWLIVIALIAAAIWYLTPSAQFRATISGGKQGGRPSASGAAGNAPFATNSFASSAAAGAIRLISAAKSAVAGATASAEQSVAQSIAGLAKDAKEAVKSQAADFLGIGPTGTSGSASMNPAPTAPPSADLAVCATIKTGTAISYTIDNPFSPPQDFSFHIDWGDGTGSSGNARAGASATLASHTYTAAGDFISVFTLTGTGETVTVTRKVCTS